MRALLLLCLLPGALLAQQTLTGTIIDAKNGEPLPYVNIFLENNQSRGVLTNEKGEFEILLTETDRNDRLLFSLLSYGIHAEPVNDLLAKDFFNLQMESSFISLGEVVVISDLGLRTLMKRVFEAIPRNYGSEDFVLTAYSRNYQIDEGKYSQFVEAIVNIQDQQYGLSVQKRRSNPVKSRVAEFRMERDTVSSLRDRWPVMGNQWQLAGFYNSNIARRGNYTLHKQDITYLESLTFSNRGEYLDGSDTLVRIGYFPSDANFDAFPGDETEENNWWRSGEFLINKNDLAIIRHSTGDAKRGHFDDVIYQKINDKYYLKQLSWYIEFEYASNTRQFIDHQMLYVTEVTTGAKAGRKAFRGKALERGEDLAELHVKYNADFWRDHQMLRTLGAPEEMKLSMDRIQQMMEARRGKRAQVKRDSF